MNLVVIPPHGDVTLAADVAPGWDRLDAGRAFAERVADVDEVTRLLDAPRAEPLDAELRLLGRAAADVLARRPPHDARLAALGAALRAGSGPPSGVRLRLDDLELAEGTTESSDDVVRASLRPAPYDQEVSRAADVARRATRVCLLVERDQQLPAALSLARALQPRAVEVAGSFADENWDVLRRVDALTAATLVPTPVRGWRVGVPWEPATTGPAWRERPSDPVPQGPWGGRVRLADVADAARLTSARCRLAILGVAGAGPDAMFDEDGSSVRVSDLAAGAAALREDGVALVAECWIGAPGQGRGSVRAAIEHLENERLADVTAGFRMFGWPVGRSSATWGGLRVETSEPLPGHDLARTRAFRCPGTLSGPEASELMQELGPRLVALGGPLPGRVAAAYTTARDGDGGGGAGAEVEPACAVIPAPDAPATWYAANLRTGVVVKLDPRIAKALVALARDGDSGLPQPVQERLFPALAAKGILRGVAS
jgi:hypothetical protein